MKVFFQHFLWSAVLALLITSSAVCADSKTGYNSIQSPLPGNLASEGFECCAVQEFGDGVHLVGTGTIEQVSVVLSSWACQTGNWTVGCGKSEGNFKLPITINIYGVDNNNNPAGILGTITQTFEIPYRPASTPALCGGDVGRWYSKEDHICYHGLATMILVNFADRHIGVPANNKIIVTVAYNTSDFGLHPIGPMPCRSTPAGCPYDSLNVSADGNGGLTGSVLDPNGVYVRPAGVPYPYSSCTGMPLTPGVLVLDTAPGCWAGYHPQIKVGVNGEKEKEGPEPPHPHNKRGDR